jgi:hypothetical protein
VDVRAINLSIAAMMACLGLCVLPVTDHPAQAQPYYGYWQRERAEYHEWRRERRIERLQWECNHGNGHACWRLRNGDY